MDADIVLLAAIQPADIKILANVRHHTQRNASSEQYLDRYGRPT
jgi:hypothetical protein